MRLVLVFALVAAAVTVGSATAEKPGGRGWRGLRRFTGSARFHLSILRLENHQGGNWAALVLSGRLALGVAASTFPCDQACELTFAGLSLFVLGVFLRRDLKGPGRAERFEGFEDQEASHEPFQDGQRQPT